MHAKLILLTFLFSTGISRTVSAQRKKVTSSEAKAPAMKFIDGIEISPNEEYIPEHEVIRMPVSMLAVPGSSSTIEKSSALQFKYAQMLNCEVEAINNVPLFDFIDEWWHTAYRYGGDSKSGIDCSAFTGKLLNDVYAINAPRTAQQQYDLCNLKRIEELRQGDLVFFKTKRSITHVGLYLGNGYFVHASSSNGVTISNLSDEYYYARFAGGGSPSHSPTVSFAKVLF